MAIDLNVSPYYDDFDKTKNFYRILFKPGRAVQARELTQLQTILQKQIEAHGSHIFKNGSIVSGGQVHVTYGTYLKVQLGNVDVFAGKNIVGATSGATGTVVRSDTATTISGTTYPAGLYLNDKTVGVFQPGETVLIDGTTTSVILSSDEEYTGPTTFFSMEEGIFYVDGYFVYCDAQTISVSKTYVIDPSARVGLKIVEQIVSSEDDSSLLDPAIGTNNYFAPGADRLQIELVLSAIEYDPLVENSDQETINKFIEVANMRFGKIIKLKTDADYNLIEDALAKRTFDESGDYTVTPFIAKVRPHVYGNIQQFSVELTPGKAYVKGYAFETISSTNLTFDKARETNLVENFPIAVDFGRYTDVVDVKGFLNSHATATYDLHNKKVGNVSLSSNVTYSSSRIGTAKIRYVDHVSSSPERYSLYLYDINLKSSNTFSEVKSFIQPNVVSSSYSIRSSANTFDSANATVITYGVDDSMLFPVPQSYVKTFKPGGSPTISYYTKKLFETVTFAAGTGGDSGNSIATISLAGNETFTGSVGVQSDSSILERFFAANVTGHVLDFTGANGSVELDSTLQQATLKVVNGSSFAANISAITFTSGAAAKTKTLTTANVVISYPTRTDILNLGYPDVVSVSQIKDYQGNSFLSSYFLDVGQRDDYYDHAMLVLQDNVNGVVLDAVNNPNVTITFQYMAHSGTSPFFSVDSYTDSGILYENIPNYTSSTGKTYNLADVLDFRPVRAPNTNSISILRNIVPGTNIICDYQYYLGRIDKITVAKNKKFEIIKGQSAVSPVAPLDNPDNMTIYSLNIPPYTKKPERDVKLSFIENKRYTMRDIGKIEKRVDRLEYYTTLSFLEKIVADQKIPSAVPGVDRFKNGFLVDPFTGHGVGDPANGDYNCSIDNVNRILRPSYTMADVAFQIVSTTDAALTGELLTPTYNETSYISQLKATRTINLTPYEVFNWVGEMSLSPSTDTWVDVTTKPAVVVNVNGENDAFTRLVPNSAGLTPISTKWNAWQQVFRGVTDVSVSTTTTSAVDTELAVDEAGNLSAQSTTNTQTSTSTSVTSGVASARTGLRYSSSGTQTIRSNLGSKIIDSSLIPYIRSRPITFVAKHLKPNTKMYATFDNVDVTRYCYPAIKITLSSNVSPDLKVTKITQSSGASGNVVLQKNTVLYVIPDVSNPVLSTGTTTLEVLDNPTISTTVSNVDIKGELITSENGDIAGVFLIPNDQVVKFNTGERQFRIADSLDKVFIQSSAQTTYLAQGISNTKQDTVLATRVNTMSIDPLSEYRQDSTGEITRSVDTSTTTIGAESTLALPPTNQITNNIFNVTENNTFTDLTVNNITNSTNNYISNVSNYYSNVITTNLTVNNNVVIQNLTNATDPIINNEFTFNNVINSNVNIVVNNSVTINDSGDQSGFAPNDYIDLICGQNDLVINGTQGKPVTYRVNLGTGAGRGNLAVYSSKSVGNAGGIPDKFILNYNGVQYNTPWLSTWKDDGNATHAQKLAEWANVITNAGYPITANRFVNPGADYYRLGFYKLSTEPSYAFVTVLRPVPGTGWSFKVECPSGSVSNANCLASVTLISGEGPGVANHRKYVNDKLHSTPNFIKNWQVTITNRSNEGSFITAGVNNDLKVKSITLDTSNLVESTSTTSTFSVVTSGTSLRAESGVINYKWNGTQTINNYYRLNDNPPPQSAISGSWDNTLSTLPATVSPGRVKTFSIRQDHPKGSVVNGKLKVNIELTDANDTPVDPTSIEIDIATLDLQEVCVQDPVAQTFFVDGAVDPNGIFITSVDAWFAEKSSSIPVRCEIRPVVNGYPSATEIVPFGTVTVDADRIVVSSTTNTFNIDENTRFTFPSPVYCPPGQYAIVLIGNDKNYRVYTAVLGETEIGTETQVTEQPYIGSLFKSQNSVTWSAEQLEDMTFRINRADFKTGTKAVINMNAVLPSDDILYDIFYATGETLVFPGAEINYSIKTTDYDTDIIDADYTPYQLGTNTPLLTRRILKADNSNSLLVKAEILTIDSKIAPVVDLGRLSGVLIRNNVNNDSTDEDGYGGGKSNARYITRRVNLASGFEAKDLKVYVDAYCPAGSSFKVYYKVNAPGTTQFDSQNKYVEMTNTAVTGNSKNSFAEFVYENSGNTCLDDGSYFNTFVIKIVMLSSNPAVVPIFRDLRVIALDDF